MERDVQRTSGFPETSALRVRDADPAAPVVAAMATRLDDGGPAGALEFLNARTRYRFTAIYRADPPFLRNIFLYDRENPALTLTSGAVSAIDDTYCGIVLANEAEFATSDSALDARLAAHPSRASVISYAGVPLRLGSGRAWGTLCHFDARPRLLLGAELAILHAAAPVLMRWLREHTPSLDSAVGAGA
jgi:GAF domain-containing protein